MNLQLRGVRQHHALHDADERLTQSEIGRQRDEAIGAKSCHENPRIRTLSRPCRQRLKLSITRAPPAPLCRCCTPAFVLSGVAALIYQTAWTRQFAIVFGTSELAVATVLAAYMGGLALGALLAERFLPRVTRPVLTYALLEIGIAASALFAVPFLLHLADLGLRGHVWRAERAARQRSRRHHDSSIC